MTTLNLLVNSELYRDLVNVINELNIKGLNIDYHADRANENGYRMIYIQTESAYAIYCLGIKIGKIQTNK